MNLYLCNLKETVRELTDYISFRFLQPIFLRFMHS